ncbi:MAG: hypothetical protein U5R48_05190 [Gammaproteobacteria bacterium]|nr:hypothetical protein [Gammaproteobacteria bacterium]
MNTEETLAAIRETWLGQHYLLDPHTAVGVVAGQELRTGSPLVCLATAHPAKFPESVERALGEDLARHPAVDDLVGSRCAACELPADLGTVKQSAREHGLLD